MKVNIKYEETEDKALHMTLRLTLPQKYVDGPTKDVVKLFVDHYNKKHEPAIVADDLHVKIVGGDHLRPDVLVSSAIRGGDECYLMGADAFIRASDQAAPAPPEPNPYAAAPLQRGSLPASGSSKLDAQGRLRCKRFGCQRFYDPDGPPQGCTHHKAPPIFHETAKWWSCCPNSKAYDFDEFMQIPGCQKGFCSNTPEGQQAKRFLGGADLRADAAPVRLDANAPKDPMVKLRDFRKGLVAMGVNTDIFDQVANKQLATDKGDVNKVCERFRARFSKLLEEAS